VTQVRLPFHASAESELVREQKPRDRVAPAFVFASHPRARRYVVRVKRDGTVRVTIPRWGSKREAQEFADTQRAWVAKQLAKFAIERTKMAPELSPDEERSLRRRAARELPDRLLTLASDHRLRVSRISIRNQRWRWGSCSRDGHICLNWRLVAMPEWVRDYVMLHELMHLKRMDHSPRFWKLVAVVCPAFREARTWLREHQTLLDSRR
jgi:predicted metal-dependent hydrolase